MAINQKKKQQVEENAKRLGYRQTQQTSSPAIEAGRAVWTAMGNSLEQTKPTSQSESAAIEAGRRYWASGALTREPSFENASLYLSQFGRDYEDFYKNAAEGLSSMRYANAQSSYDDLLAQTGQWRQKNAELLKYLETNKGLFDESSYEKIVGYLSGMDPELKEFESAYKDAYDFHMGWGSEAGDKAGTAAYSTKYEEARQRYQNALNNLQQIEDEGGFITTVELYNEYEPRWQAAKAELEKAENALRQIAPESIKDAPKWGKVLGLSAMQGLDQAGMGVAQTIDFLAGGLIDEGFNILRQTGASLGMDIDWDKPNAWDRYLQKGAEGIQNTSQRIVEAAGDSKAAQTIGKYGPMVVEAVPQSVIALMTAGTSTAAQGTTAAVRAAANMAQAGRAAQAVMPVINATASMAKDPAWLYSFTTTAGSSYADALADGATEEEAALYSLLSSSVSAMIETGGSSQRGGIDKLPKQIQEALARGDRSTVLKWLKSIGSESVEEVLQGISSNAARGVYDPNLEWGSMTDENAVFNPNRMLEEAKGGAIVSTILGGAQIGAIKAFNAVASQNARNEQLVNTYGEYTQELAQQGLELKPGNRFAQRMLDRAEAGKDLSAGQIGRLVRQNEKAINANDVTLIRQAAENRLKELGETGDVSELAKVLSKRAQGKALSRAERNLLNESRYGNRVANELNAANIESGEFSTGWAENIGTERINARQYNKGTEESSWRQIEAQVKAQLEGAEVTGDIEALSRSMTKALLGEELGVIEEAQLKRNRPALAVLREMAQARNQEGFEGSAGGAVRTAFGDEELIQAMREVEKGLPEYMRVFSRGETNYPSVSAADSSPDKGSQGGQNATAPAENGNEIEAQSLSQPAADSSLYTREPEEVTETELDKAMIEDTVKTLGVSRKVARALILSRKDVDPDVYALGIQEAFEEGAQGLPRSQVGKDPESYAAKLSETQRELAHRAGQLFGGKGTARAQAEVRKAVKQSKGRKGPGKVHYNTDKKSLNERQQKSIKVLERVAAALGVDFYIEPKGLSSNGWYDPKDGSIHIATDAGSGFEGSILFTAAHELTHFIQDWSPAKYRVLANFLFEQYAISGADVAQRMTEQIANARADGRELTPGEAYDEVVADSMEKMLLDGRVLTQLEAIKQQDASLFSKMQQYFKKLFKRIQSLYSGLETNSEEARIVERMGADTVRKIQDYFIEGLADAGESYQAAGGTKNTTDNGGVRYSDKSVVKISSNDTTEGKDGNPYSGKSLYKDAEVYDYAFMVKLPPMEVNSMPPLSEVKTGNRVDQNKAVGLGLENAASVGRKVSEKMYAIKNVYTDRDVLLGEHGLEHGLEGGDIGRLRTNARLTAIGGQIVQNAVPVNGLKNKNSQVKGTYAMACLLKSGNRDVVAIVTVEEHTSKAVGIDYVDITHAIGGRLRKNNEGSLSSTRETGYGQVSVPTAATFKISIEDFLEIVNATHKSILSKNVLEHFAEERPSDGHYADRVLFQSRDTAAVERANRSLERQNAKLKEDIKELKKLLKLQKSVSKGSLFNPNSVDAAAKALMKSVNAKGDRAELRAELERLYKYIATEKELSWEGVRAQASGAAAWLMQHMDREEQLDPYAEEVLRELKGLRVSLNEGQLRNGAYAYGGVREFRNAAMGKFIISKQAMPLDSAWAELSASYPNLFDPEISDADQGTELIKVFERLRGMTLENEIDHYDSKLLERELIRQVYDSYWDISTMQTVADTKQEEINQLKTEHRRQMAELKAEHEREMAELKKSYKAETAKIRREAEQKYMQKRLELLRQVEESRQRNAANREISNLRRLISREAGMIDRILNKATRERNVKEGMQGFVATALQYHGAIFADSYTPEEMIKAGFTVPVQKKEEGLISSAREIMRELEGVSPGSDRERKLRGRLDYRIRKLNELIARQREAMYKANVDTVLNELLESYKKLQNSEYNYIKDSYDPELAAFLEGMAQEMSGQKAIDMSVQELRNVYDAFKAVHKAILNTNKAFETGADVRAEGAESVQEIKAAGGSKKQRTSLQTAARRFGFNNMKPVYFFKLMGSSTLSKYFRNVLRAEGVWAKDVEEAKAHARKLMEKYKYDSWDMNKPFKFKSTNGDEFELTVPQMLTLYALTQRGGSVFDHLRTGGFVFDPNSTRTVEGKLGIKKELNLDDATAYQLGVDELGLIARALSEEQKAFVKEMQEYLSTVMGGKGNEVSMKMYGIKLFKEERYFPLRVASQYMERIREAGSNERKIKNSGFTKPLKPNANNPVVLGDFTDIWSQHVNDMSMYHAFVLPLEDFYRVYNYKTRAEDNAAMESVNAAIQNAYGKPAAEYVDQLLKDINSGAIRDPRANLTTALVGKFKKASTFASASVIIQQPSSVGRAFALIDPKYFVGRRMDNLAHYSRWAEIKKYAPIAIIKEMGHFDTNMGRSTSDYIQQKEYKSLKEKIKGVVTDEQYRDDILSRLPALADEVTWCCIWEAVKRETAAKRPELKSGSEEFMQAVGERFTEVIQETQVYDSVLSRSAYMRSKDSGMTMLTAFMAEPTTTMNMVLNAIVQGRRGDKAAARRAIGAALTSVVMNAALVSIVYAMRDDDEYESFLEKYLASFAVEIADGVNPFTYFPVIRDIWSAAQGYDIERADMSLITDLMDSINNTTKLLYQDTEDMSEKEREAWLKKLKDALWKDADYITALVGLPVKNIRRDIMAVGNTIGTLAADYKTSPEGLKNVVGESLISAVPFLGQRPKDSKGDKIYAAIMAGDTEYADRLFSSYATESAASSALRKAMRDNEPRIVLAAAARLDGDTDEYMRIYNELLTEGNFERDDIIKAIESEMNAMSNSESSSTPASPDLIKPKDYYRAILAGDSAAVEAARQAYIQQELEKGKLEEDAVGSLESSVTASVRADYMEDAFTREDAMALLMGYGGKAEEDADAYLRRLDFEKQYGFSWDEREEAYRRGEISEQELAQGYMDMKGMNQEEAELEAEYIAVTAENPELRVLSVGQYKDYYTPPDGWSVSPADIGIARSLYAQYRLDTKGMTGEDLDGDGKNDPNSKKNKILAYIDSLPLTAEQKDLLYYQQGYKASTLNDAPWHK